MSGIYIHIPFCKKVCHYCNFHHLAGLKYKETYLDALKKEIISRKSYLTSENTSENIVNTIYFGGGTPSIIDSKEIESILNTIHQHFKVNAKAEITLEANPDDLSNEKLHDFKAIGINRLSIGIQSFKDLDLQYLNRSHNAETAYKVIENSKNCGIDNISIDLIYGIPTSTDAIWEQNLILTQKLNIPHLSAYSLTVEPDTNLQRLIEKGKLANIDENKTLAQFDLLMQFAEDNDYLHYEISNFCKKKFESKHNSSYWKGISYLGVGTSAHSYNSTSRQWNVSNVNDYIKCIQSDNNDYFETEILSDTEKYNEYVMTSIRTSWGVNFETIKAKFGSKYAVYFEQKINNYIDSKAILKTNNIYTLTQYGKTICDYITVDLFYMDF